MNTAAPQVQEQVQDLKKKVFRPRKSNGMNWAAGVGLLLLLLSFGEVSFGQSGSLVKGLNLLIGTVIGGLGVYFMLLAVWFTTMRYEFDGQKLTLIYGPVLRYAIDLRQVKNVRCADLTPGMLSVVRLPGLALFGIPFVNAGVVYMCATSVTSAIVLIETGKITYGVTPGDESTFVTEIRQRMNG